ncbi:MAG TPA: HAD-IIB family hydrolase [Vicinamibacteria bacterium]|jgi:mannosyl-3-phosphoglycerate phosphatase
MSQEPALLVATDLDGTLLDEWTYAHDAADPALRALAARKALIVLCSSKTRAEMAPLVRLLAPGGPFIGENGGILVVPESQLSSVPDARREGDAWLLELGVRRDVLAPALGSIARETGLALRSFTRLPLEEAAALTGLDLEATALAQDRRYDEPFLLDDPSALPAVEAAARSRGLRVTRGGRFHHLTGPTDKGRALRVLLGLYATAGRSFRTLALGDSTNDLPLLQAVDRAIVVPRPGGGPDASLRAALPDAELAPEAGPSGWNAAVLAVLRGERLPRVSGPGRGDA